MQLQRHAAPVDGAPLDVITNTHTRSEGSYLHYDPRDDPRHHVGVGGELSSVRMVPNELGGPHSSATVCCDAEEAGLHAP